MMMVDARGKLGGQVFTKSRQGATVRTKVTPSNPQSQRQGLVRGVFASFSRSWNTITEAQRETWQSASQQFKRTNIFGDQVALSGKNLYISVNSNLTNVGESPITSAPTLSDVISIASFGLKITTLYSFINLDISYTGVESASQVLVVEATRPNSPGRNNFSGQYRQITSFPSDDPLDPALLWDAYVDKFGLPAVGSKVSFRIYVVNKQNGFASPKSATNAIVA